MSRILLFFFLVPALFLNAVFADDILDAEVYVINLRNAYLDNFIAGLSRKTQVSMCLEQELVGDGDCPKIDLDMKTSTLKSVLNEIIQKLPAYTWVFDDKNQIINIYPKDNPPLNWLLDEVHVKNMPVREFLEKDYLKFNENNFSLDWLTEPSDLDTRLEIDEKNVCVRNVINEISCKLPNKMFWIITPVHRDGTTYYFLSVHKLTALGKND